MENTFQLRDRNGEAHQYVVEPHGALKGLELATKIWGLAVPSTLTAIGTLLESDAFRGAVVKALSSRGRTTPPEEQAKGWEVLLQFAQGLDLGRIGQEAGAALLGGQIPELLQSLLQGTTRDGKPLRTELVFEEAYRANPFEALQAAWRVCTINGFFPALPGLGAGALGVATAPPGGGQSSITTSGSVAQG